MASLNVMKNLPNKLPHLCLQADDAGRIPLHVANGASKASFDREASRNSVQEVRIAVPNQGEEDMDMPAASNYSHSGLSSTQATITSPTQQPSMLLNGMVFTAGATYAGLFNFTDVFPLDNNPNHFIRTFRSREVFISPRSLPEGFWFLTATTFAFVSSMISILIAICSASGKWSFWVTAVSLFVFSSFFISYMMMLERLVPHFKVITASGQMLSGFEMLCLYTLIVILLLMAVVLMVRILWTFRPRMSSN